VAEALGTVGQWPAVISVLSLTTLLKHYNITLV